MKTLHLAIIVILVIGISYVIDKNVYGCTGFCTARQSSESSPSPLKQFNSGIAPNNVTCNSGLQLIIKAEDGSPACVGPENVANLVERGWAKQAFYYHDTHVEPKITLNDYSYAGIDEEDNTTVSIDNQTYYQTTLNYSAYRLPEATPIQFHNVTFTFPAGTMITPGGAFVMLDMKFPDGFEEIYGTHTANEFGGIPLPTQYGPHLAVNSTTVLSNHIQPQGGMTVYHDKIRLLVSVDENSTTSNNNIMFGSIKYDFTSFLPDVKKTVNLDGISFTYTDNGTFTKGDCYGTWINQTEAKSFTVKADNEFSVNAYQCWPPFDYPNRIMENGAPVHIMPSGYNYSFFDTNQTAGVAWCNLDACPLGKSIYLVKQGWNLPETYDLPSSVQFYFKTNSSAIHVGQTIGVDMGDNNTQPKSIRLPFSYEYSFKASSLFPCDYGPYRIAVFEGNVTMEDTNNAKLLHFYEPGDYSCQAPEPGKFWTFKPLSNIATVVCHLDVYCNDTMSNRHISFNGYWDENDRFHLLENGNYTIFASDPWGHLAIQHFTVTNSTR